MIKLKHLLIETLDKLDLSKSQSGIAFTTSADMIKFNDPYEYKFKNGLWYTRKWKSGDKRWLDMKEVLSLDDWEKAVDIILNKVYRVKTSDVLKNPDLDKTSEETSNKETPIDKDREKDLDNKKPKTDDRSINRDDLGYIISGKSSVYGKTISLRTNMQDAGIAILKQLDIDDIDRKTGKIDHGFTDAVTTLWPEEAKYYQVGDIKTITMPVERGMYSKQEDPNSGRKFTYLYIVGSNGYKGWIPSNTVKINS